MQSKQEPTVIWGTMMFRGYKRADRSRCRARAEEKNFVDKAMQASANSGRRQGI